MTNLERIILCTPTELANSVFMFPRVSSRDLNKTTPGRCRYCRCTDDRACDEGCWWIDQEQTICSSRECVTKFQTRVRELYAKAPRRA